MYDIPGVCFRAKACRPNNMKREYDVYGCQIMYVALGSYIAKVLFVYSKAIHGCSENSVGRLLYSVFGVNDCTYIRGNSLMIWRLMDREVH